MFQIRIAMEPHEWWFILGWLDGKDIPINMPMQIIELRTKIKEALREYE